jgi:Tfp pilus assembly protein PilZ
MEIQERRKYKRIVLDFPADYASERFLLLRNGKNISAGGMFIQTEVVDPPGTKTKLEFYFPHLSDKICTEGMIVWSSAEPVKVNEHEIRPAGMGIVFAGIAERIKERIEKA